jgi:hypothetical protein
MSDVPVTAAWLASWTMMAERRAALAGMLAGIAALIRPNLAPLAAIPAAFLLLDRRRCPLDPATGATRASGGQSTVDTLDISDLPGTPNARGTPGIPGTGRIVRQVVAYSIPVAVAGLVVAWFQWQRYTSPFLSGYGRPAELYAIQHLPTNLSRYFGWLVASESPLLWLAVVAVIRPRSRMTRSLMAFAALVVLSYALYLIVEQWTYLRFLLPAIGIAIAVASAVVIDLLAPLRAVWKVPLVAALILVLAAHGVASARAMGAFDLWSVHQRALLVGHFLDPLVMPNAVIIAGEQSGSMRYYTGRSIVRWEAVEHGKLGLVLEALGRARREPWIVLDTWEEEPFRARFGDIAEGRLDWPPAVDAGREARTRAWRVADRARFMRGQRVWTDRLR